MPPKWNWELFEQLILLEITRVFIENDKFDVHNVCKVMTDLRERELKSKLTHVRSAEEVNKQIFAAIAVDSAYQKLIKEQLRLSCCG